MFTRVSSWDTCLVSRHVSRLETHIYTSLSWLGLDVFMSCLDSSLVAPCLVLALSWCVLAQCLLRSWHTRFEQLMLVKCNQMWHSMTVICANVYDCICAYEACWSNVKLFWFVSCISAVSQVSNIFTMSQSRLDPNPKCLGSSHVSIPLYWPISPCQKQWLKWGAQSPPFPFEPPAIVWTPLIESIVSFYA